MVPIVKYFDWKIPWQAESSQVLAVLACGHTKVISSMSFNFSDQRTSDTLVTFIIPVNCLPLSKHLVVDFFVFKFFCQPKIDGTLTFGKANIAKRRVLATLVKTMC